MLNVAVFGNSNSILRDGWVKNLANKSGVKIKNFALGGSPSPSHLYQLLHNMEDISDCDLFIIEPSIIDWRFGETEESAQKLYRYANSFVSIANKLGKEVVMLDLPWPENMDVGAWASCIWKHHVLSSGGKVVDCFYLIKRLAEKVNAKDYSIFYRDKLGHLAGDVQEWISNCLYDYCISDNLLDGCKKINNAGIINYYLMESEEIADSSGLKNNLVERANNLTKSLLLPIRRDDILSIKIPEDGGIVGALWNFGETCSAGNCVLRWTDGFSNFEHCHTNKYLPAEPVRKLLLMFEPLNFKFNSAGDVISIRLVNDMPNGEFIELAGLIVERNAIKNNVSMSSLNVENKVFERFADKYVEKTHKKYFQMVKCVWLKKLNMIQWSFRKNLNSCRINF
jgi:hypothetical protein